MWLLRRPTGIRQQNSLRFSEALFVIDASTILARFKSRFCSLQELLLPPAKAVFAKLIQNPLKYWQLQKEGQ